MREGGEWVSGRCKLGSAEQLGREAAGDPLTTGKVDAGQKQQTFPTRTTGTPRQTAAALSGGQGVGLESRAHRFLSVSKSRLGLAWLG